ncbi:MAG TPA: hypothetical protein VGO11_21250 [Chthoniobacteraceae bacterium]|jgi:hypothetical protein|nr:hypothetical protein [Chthoniobacteraceae bacterium]
MTASHPASPSAPEASMSPERSTLRADANTLRTRELLAQRERQAAAAESETPAGQTIPTPNGTRP